MPSVNTCTRREVLRLFVALPAFVVLLAEDSITLFAQQCFPSRLSMSTRAALHLHFRASMTEIFLVFALDISTGNMMYAIRVLKFQLLLARARGVLADLLEWIIFTVSLAFACFIDNKSPFREGKLVLADYILYIQGLFV